MTEPRDERVTHRGDPAGGRNRHEPPKRLPTNPPLQPHHLSERVMPAEGVALRDEIDATSGLGLDKPEFGDVNELPRVNLYRSRRPFGDIAGGRGAEPAVSIKD